MSLNLKRVRFGKMGLREMVLQQTHRKHHVLGGVRIEVEVGVAEVVGVVEATIEAVVVVVVEVKVKAKVKVKVKVEATKKGEEQRERETMSIKNKCG